MFNIKWGVVSAAAAFALAFVMSLLIGHTGLLVAVLRALIFAALFFGLGTGIRALITAFLPELLSEGQEEASGNVFLDSAGSRVNLTVDDAPNAALPAAMPGTMPNADNEEDEEIGSFTDLVSGSFKAEQDIDQSPATSYTDPEIPEIAPAFDDKVKVEGLGDFSMDFGAFVSDDLSTDGAAKSNAGMDTFSFPSGASDVGNSRETSASDRKASRNKPARLEGDFDAKEIAAGIQTVLKKDKG